MDIYIKPVKKAVVYGREFIRVGDLCDVVTDTALAEKIKEFVLIKTSSSQRKKNYLIKCTDVIRAIKAVWPYAHVVNVGEKDTVVLFFAEKPKRNPLLLWAKVAFVTLVLLTGSATAIMSFHTDAQIPKVFENFHKIIYGKENKNPLVITIPYSIGLALGIAVFYNHALGKKLSDDPTPLEVEMSNYENEVTDTVRDTLNAGERA